LGPRYKNFVAMADTGLLVDISDPGGGDCGGNLGPLNLRRGRNSLASSHPKTLEEEDDPFGLLERAKETRDGAVVKEIVDNQTPVGTLVAIDRQPASGSIGSATPFHLVTTPSSCLDSVFSPSLDSQTSEEPNWDQLQSDAQSVASSCSEQPSLSDFPSVSSFTPASHLKMEMDSPLALLNLSKEDSFLVALTPDKPPTASLVDEMSKMAIKVQDEVEHEQEAATSKVEAGEAICQMGGELNKADIRAEPKTPKNKQADIKALKRRLSAIKENRDPVKPAARKTTGSEAKPLGRRSLAPVQPKQGLGLVKSRQGCDPPDVEVQKTGSSALAKVSHRKPALLKLTQSNKAPSTPSSLKQKMPLTLNKGKQATSMAPPQGKVKSVRGRGMPLPANPSNHQAAPAGVEPNLSPSISESGFSEVASSPLGPPQASSSTPSRKGQIFPDVSKDAKADPKMPRLKVSATPRTSQFGQVKPRSFSAKTPSATISKPTRPEVKPKDSLNTSIQNVRKQPSAKTTIASSLNTTGPSSFSPGGTSPKKVVTPMLRPPQLSRLRPPTSGLRPPSSGLRPPTTSVGLKTENILSTPKMRPPSSSAIKPPSASLSRQGLSSTPQSRIRSSLPSPQVVGPMMHSTPRRTLQTPVRSQR